MMFKQSKAEDAFSFAHVLCKELDLIKKLRAKRAGKKKPDEEECDGLDEALKQAHETHLFGLAFSGGGVRSATFNLGILQGLARLKILASFDYLSTVSGGGYIGSWFSAWISRKGFHRVQEGLVPERAGRPDKSETHEVKFLRNYSNYLTPRKGIFGADTWTAIAPEYSFAGEACW